MTKVTPSDVAVMRRYPQEAELRLSIFKPTTALACKVNMPLVTKGARVITFNTVSSGSWTNVVSGMTMMVGSTLGASDLGTIRVKSATSTQITVAENKHIQWSNGLFLTVLYFFDIVPIFPRITVDTKGKITFYKDYDIEYTNQNNILGTLICMGSHRQAELLDYGPSDGTVAKIYYSSTGTYNVNDQGLAFSWNFEGATITGTTLQTPGFVSYPTPGNFITTLTTTSTSGAVDKSYRYVIIESPDDAIKDWRLENMQSSRASGGYLATITINEQLGFDLTPGTVMILTAKERYNTTIQNIGGTHGQQDIFFVGYVIENTVVYSYDRSSVTFQIGTISEVMKLATGFAISIEDTSTTPQFWYQIKNLNLKKAIYHYWKWHSTAMLTTDVQYIGTDYRQQFFDSNKESLYEAVSSALKSTRFGELVCDRVGKLWCEISVAATPNAPSAFTSEMILGKDDWIGEPSIPIKVNDEQAYMELGGIYYKGGTAEGSSVPLLACAPGDAPGNRGKHVAQTGLSLSSQSQLNNLVGDVLYYRNYPYHNIKIDMRGTFKNFDIAPQKALTLNIAAEDTVRNIAISGTFFPTNISWKYDHENLTLLPTIVLEPITNGPVGETIIVPPVPPSGPKVTIPKFPKIRYPEIPGPGHIEPPEPPITPLGLIVIYFYHEAIVSLDTVNTPYNWLNITATGWTAGEIDGLEHFTVDPFGIVYMASDSSLYSQSALAAGSRSLIASQAYFDGELDGGTGDHARIKAIGASSFSSGRVGVLAVRPHGVIGVDVVKGKLGAFITAGGALSMTYATPDEIEEDPSGLMGGEVSYAEGVWIATAFDDNDLAVYKFDAGFAPDSSVLFVFYPGAGYFAHARAGGGDLAYGNTSVGDDVKIGKYEPSSLTLLENTGIVVPARYSVVACDPGGQYVMAGFNDPVGGNVGEVYRSEDYGVTWSAGLIGTTVPSISWDSRAPYQVNNVKVHNLGDPDTWVIVFNATVEIDEGVPLTQCLHVFQTFDFGETWEDIAEDLRGVIPFNSAPWKIGHA